MLKVVFSNNNLTQFQSDIARILNLMNPISIVIGDQFDDYTAKVTLEYNGRGRADKEAIHIPQEANCLQEVFCASCEVYAYDINENDNITDCHMFRRPTSYECNEYSDRVRIEIKFDELHVGPSIDNECKEIEILQYYAMALNKLMKEAFDKNTKEEKKMDIKMKLRDFVVNKDGEYILKNCKEGDRWSKILTKDMEIKSMSPSGLTISLVDEPDQMIMVLLPNDDKILINAEECPIGEFLGDRTVLYERTCIKKWNDTLSPGHFYLTFDNDGQIGDVVFLVRLEDNFLKWEEFSCVETNTSYYLGLDGVVELSMDSLTNRKFIPLYGIGLKIGLNSIGLDLNEERS